MQASSQSLYYFFERSSPLIQTTCSVLQPSDKNLSKNKTKKINLTALGDFFEMQSSDLTLKSLFHNSKCSERVKIE